jgi:hypothetical protein
MLTGGFTGLIGDPDEHEEVSQHLVNTVAPAVFAEAGMSCKRMKIVGPVEYGAVTGHAVIMYGDGSRKLKELTDEPCYRALVENDGGERKFVHALYICANGLIRDELEGDDFVFAPTRSIEKPEPGPEPEPEYRVTETNGSVIISNANGQSIVIALPEEMRLVFQRDDRICISVVGFPNINVELPMGNVRADLLPLAEPDQSEPETEMQTGPGPENPVMVETGDDAPPVLLGMGANGTSSENREDLPAGEFSRN